MIIPYIEFDTAKNAVEFGDHMGAGISNQTSVTSQTHITIWLWFPDLSF